MQLGLWFGILAIAATPVSSHDIHGDPHLHPSNLRQSLFSPFSLSW